jgi:TonB family protein
LKPLTNTKVQGLTIAASIAVHAVLTAALSLLAFRSLAAATTAEVASTPGPASAASGAVPLELPAVGAGIFLDEQPIDPTGDVPRITAGDEVARVDQGRAGRGGDPTVREAALNLADVDEHMRLSPDSLNRLDRDQLQRLRVARKRTSWEDRRSTTHPAELSLVVSGSGHVFERRPVAAMDPSRGALQSPRSSVPGAALGTAPAPEDDPDTGQRAPGSETRGSREAAPGQGLLDGRPGRDHRAAAPIASARPAITRGPVAVPAADRALPTDDVDGQQEVATTLQSIVHASSMGGLAGDGAGGSGGGGEAAAGGVAGDGSRSAPLGAGRGDVFDYWTSDPRLVSYFRQIHAKIDPLWADAFPRGALLDLEQGTVILDFTVYADGHVVVSWPPVRPSGVDAFDRNCADAIRRAAPFPPIPRRLGVSVLHVRAPFVASNPIIH